MKRMIYRAFVPGFVCLTLFSGSCNFIIHPDPPSGTPLWAKTAVGGTASSLFSDVAVTDDGIYAVGSVGQGALDLGNGVVVTGIHEDNVLIAKFDGNIKPIWARTVITADDASSFNNIVVTEDNIYVSGNLYGLHYDFGNSVVIDNSPAHYPKAILVKYNKNGIVQSATTIKGSSMSFMKTIAFLNDSIFAVGSISGTEPWDFGNSIFAQGPSVSHNAFVVKYSAHLEAQWVKTAISGTSSQFNSMVCDNGFIYIAGETLINGSIDFGNSVTTSGYLENVNSLLVQYDINGTPYWAVSTEFKSTSQGAAFNEICADKNYLYCSGIIRGSGRTNFGGNVFAISPYNGTNGVVVKYDTAGNPQWAHTVAGAYSNSYFLNILSDYNSIYICGYLEGYSTFNFGNGISIDALSPNSPLITKFATNGNALWAKSILPIPEVSGSSNFIGMTSNSGKIYVVGNVTSLPCYFSDHVSACGFSPTRNYLMVSFLE
ncbi:MAG: hypothetical protein JXD23_16265 [Spirochaetales bacterium]|nr:hypothetical protein [Spirochaetales bacterium]